MRGLAIDACAVESVCRARSARAALAVPGTAPERLPPTFPDGWDNFVLRCVRAMEQTAHDRVLFYEQCIQTLSDELTRPGLMPADRDRIAREIASAMAALASCRKELQRNTH